MNIRILALVIFVAFSTGCKKDPFSPETSLASDFVLERFRELTNGQTKLDVERALNLDAATSFNARLRIKDQNLVLTLGGQKVTTVEPKISASIVFLGQIDPMKIAGTYTLPNDRNKVDIYFMEHTPTGIIEANDPASGTLEIRYDATTQRYSGTITKVRYPIPAQANYVFEEFDGVFNHIKFIPE